MFTVNVYKIVTEQICRQLEQGVVPWRKPWKDGVAVSWKTQKPYRGINVFLLPPGEYATFKQIQEHGGRVKKGEKGHLVVFWKWLEKENEETGEVEKFPLLRYYKVFEVNTQAEGIPSRRQEPERVEETFEHDVVGACEAVIEGYVDAPEIRFAPGEAFYHKVLDYVQCPPLRDFESLSGFYGVLFHELVHSTGHPSRLNRKGIAGRSKFGDEDYSQEELVAELGAAMLCAHAGISSERTLQNSASYIQGWLKVLRSDARLVVQAASQAQKACDYILGKDTEEE